MRDAAIETDDLTKVFPGGVVAVNTLDLAVPRGSVYGLIGRNGAGKTTALRMIMGLLRPTRGSATVLGKDLWTATPSHRARVTYVSQEQRLPGWMTVDELGTYASHFYPRWDAPYAEHLVDRFSLPRHLPTGLLSGGERRKAAILLALAPRPEVLVMDEPAAGLDPIARRELVDELIDALAEGDGPTVVFSTHIISDLERVADHVGIMDRGRIVTAGALSDLQTATKRVQLIFEGDAVPTGFRLPGTVRAEVAGPVLTAVVRLQDEAQQAAIEATPNARVNFYPLGLEEIFIEIFGPEADREFHLAGEGLR